MSRKQPANRVGFNLKRVIAYVDGFNLYFGLKSKGWKRYYWLDVSKLASNLLKPNQSLQNTKYFTSRIMDSKAKIKRQTTYIEALETLDNFEIYYGKYQMNDRKCTKCGLVQSIPFEKMTDVNIATELLSDAFQDQFDLALLISADSDLSAPLQKVRRLFPNKKIVLAFPPARFSSDLAKVANAYITIGRGKITKSQIPDEVTKTDGYILKRPDSWR